MHHGRLILFLFIVLVCSLTDLSLVNAGVPQEKSIEQNEQSPPDPAQEPEFNIDINPIILFFKMFGFIIVIGMILYFGLRAYKTLASGNGMGGRHSAPIKILSSSVIGPKKSLCLVDALDHLLLLGVTDGQISVLLQIPATELNEETKNSLVTKKRNPDANFRKLVNSFLKK